MEARIAFVREAMRRRGLELLIAAAPGNVRMLSGYWPVTGKSLVVVRKDRMLVLVPEDEERLAKVSWADEVQTYEAGSLSHLRPVATLLRDKLRELVRAPGATWRIGFEGGELSVPSSYVGTAHLREFGDWLRQTFPTAELQAAPDLFEECRSILFPAEILTLRECVSIARRAFEAVREFARPGLREYEVAAQLSGVLQSGATAVHRAGGEFFCMSGFNSARAYAAYQQNSDRTLERGDVLLVHCNSYLDGLWTDITRTYVLGPADERRRGLQKLLLQARDAAVGVIGPGVSAKDVDRAARDVIAAAGFGQCFRHGTGHGVGFSAIDHLARPRIHPAADDVLEAGMVFNIEPAVYFENDFGMRHCDMVRVTKRGCELLTDMPAAEEFEMTIF